MTHEQKVRRWISPNHSGVEIGAFKYPVPGITPFYVDCFTEFGAEPVKADYYGHACLLPFHTNSLDYVVASHVLEHVANPVAALAEWYRVLRPGGLIYLIVPDRRFTWDHPRNPTPIEHFLDDFTRGTTASDATHIDDFALGIDWSTFSPATPTEQITAQRQDLAQGMHHAVARGEQVNIHFHVFEPENLFALLEKLRSWPPTRFHWQVVDGAERFPEDKANGIFVAIRVKKNFADHLSSLWHRLLTRSDPRHPVRPDAQPFSDFVQTARGLGGVR